MTATERFVPVGIGFSHHPKLSDLRRKGPTFYGKAVALWLLGRLHVEREQTGGVVPDVDLRMIYDAPDVARLAEALVEVGLWDRHQRGYAVHNVETSGGVLAPAAATQPTDPRELAKARRRERNRKYRETRRETPQDVSETSRETGVGVSEDVSRDAARPSQETPRDVSRDTPLSDSPPSETVEERSGDAREASRETLRDVSQDGTRTSDKTPADVSRWASWLSWRDEHQLPIDAPANRQHLETAWQHVERKLATKLGKTPAETFETLCRAYLAWPDGTPLPGGKVPVRGDRPASWLASGVYQLAEHLGAPPKPTKLTPAEEAAARRRLAAERDARAAS